MNDIVCYPGNAQVSVRFDGETVWLTQKQMAELFGCDVPNISKHLANIFSDGEIEEMATVSKMEIVETEGQRTVTRTVMHYNLDAIISVGYRVNSKRGVAFRQWATKMLKERLLRDYVPKSEAAQVKMKPTADTVELIRRTLYDNVRKVLTDNGVSAAESVFIWDCVASEWLGRHGITMPTVRDLVKKGKLGFIVPEKSNFPTYSKDPLRAHGLFCVDSWNVRDDIASMRRPYTTYIVGRAVSGAVGLVRKDTNSHRGNYKASAEFGARCLTQVLPGGVVL